MSLCNKGEDKMQCLCTVGFHGQLGQGSFDDALAPETAAPATKAMASLSLSNYLLIEIQAVFILLESPIPCFSNHPDSAQH